MDVVVDDWATRRRRDGADARAATIAQYVRAAGGIVRSSTLRSRGFSERGVRAAVDAGLLERVRRVWLATPDVDPALKFAADAGVILTCVTQAERLEVWTLARDAEVHVAVPAHRAHVRSDARLHWAAPIVARHPHALVDPIENVLALAAACQPFESALAMWESAFRKRLADPVAIGRLDLPGRARDVLKAAQPVADSGLETIFRVRLGWLRLPIRSQVWLYGHSVDFLIGDRLVVQIDGGHHVGVQRTSDIAHDAVLKLHGFHVIRIGYEQVIHRWPEVHDLIVAAVAQNLHRA